MSESLDVHADSVSETIANWASRLYMDSHTRAEQKARNAAQELADEVGILAKMTLPERHAFVLTTGKRAAENIRLYS